MQIRSDDETVVIDLASTGITLTAPTVKINATSTVDIVATGVISITGSDVVITPLTGGTF